LQSFIHLFNVKYYVRIEKKLMDLAEFLGKDLPGLHGYPWGIPPEVADPVGTWCFPVLDLPYRLPYII
jgi:hypothetical protein